MEPILSTMQQAMRGMSPESFMGNAIYATGRLQGELEWRFENFSLFHQLVYKGLDEENKKLNEFAESKREILDAEFTEEVDLIAQSRVRTAILTHEDVLGSIKSISDESSVVGLWAIVEQFLARSYALLESKATGVKEEDVDPPYRWDQLKHKYKAYGVDLESLPYYDIANECRVLNNKIKHLYCVDDELALFPNYASSKGKSIKQVILPMQDYMDGCYMFLGHALEKTGIFIDQLPTNQASGT